MMPALTAFAAVISQQKEAMEVLHETSERLFECICRGDTGSLTGIIETRSAACIDLGKVVSTASAVDFNLEELANSQHREIRQVASEILQTSRQIELLRIRIMTRQSECEEALRAALADTARQLRGTAGEKKVRFAYQAAPGPTPRYLDSRK